MRNRKAGFGPGDFGFAVIGFVCLMTCLSAAGADRAEVAVEYVVHVSVDGLRSDAVAFLGPEHLPNFHRMRIAGIWTDDARTDYDYTVTLPNHAYMLTARPVLGPDGHGVSFNSDPGTTFEAVKGYYIAGVFDVVHDNGRSTAMFASKSKFAFFERSWDGINGAPDTTGADDGRDKIDTYVNVGDTRALIDSFVLHTTDSPHTYSFVHFVDPDAVGHDSGWGSTAYYHSVMKVDTLLGRIFDLVDEGPMAGVTAVIVTADHGGTGTSHNNPLLPENYTVPLYVTGPGVPAGAGIYTLNTVSRLDPLDERPDYDASPQPVRNGGTSNLALWLLGLGPIPGSVINADQDLDVTVQDGVLPEVSISSPEDGALFDSPATIEIEAAVQGGSIARVEFYADWVEIGEDATNPYTCTWTDVMPGEYIISSRAVRNDGIASVAHIDIGVVSITGGVEGEQTGGVRIYPNPATGSSTVLFSLSSPANIEMAIYDALGRRIDTVLAGLRGPGAHKAGLDTDRLAPGLYFYRMNIGSVVSSGKFLVLR
jgi:hypothetical protein